MSATYLGSLTVGGTIPGAVTAINLAIPTLQAQIAALAAFAPSVVPPSFSADLSVAAGITANLQASIALGITPPSISAQLSIVAAILADLSAQLAAINATVSLFAAAGVHAYAYAGTAGALGGDFTTTLSTGFPGGGGAGASCNALLLGTEVGATWTAMGGVFKVTP